MTNLRNQSENNPRPWIRFGARCLDDTLYAILMVVIVALLQPALVQLAAQVPKLAASLLILFLLLPAYFATVEATLLSTWGYTPAKWILGITVTAEDGQKPHFIQAFIRALLVYLVISGLYIPGATIIVQLMAYFSYQRSGITPWDQICNTKVTFAMDRSNDLAKMIVLIPIAIGSIYFAWSRYSDLQKHNEPQNKSRQAIQQQVNKHFQKGHALAQAAHFNEALIEYNEIVKIDPTLIPAYEWQGQMYNRVGRFSEAIASSNRCLALDANNAIAYITRATAYCELGQLKSAFTDANKAQASDPRGAWACHLIKAMVYLKEKQPQQALAESNIAIKLKPKYPDCYKVRGDTYLSLGQTTAAISDLTQAINLYPNYAKAYETRAQAYEKAGNPLLASQDKQKAKQLAQK